MLSLAVNPIEANDFPLQQAVEFNSPFSNGGAWLRKKRLGNSFRQTDSGLAPLRCLQVRLGRGAVPDGNPCQPLVKATFLRCSAEMKPPGTGVGCFSDWPAS